MASSETVNIVLAAQDLASGVFASVSKQARGLEEATEGMGAKFRDLAILAAPAAAVIGAAGAAMAATFEIAAAAADAGDALNDMAKRTGISVEALSQYRLAAEQSGTSLEGLALGMRGLSQNMLDAANPASQASQAFKALGVSAFDSAGKARPLDQMLGVLADKFAAMPDGPEKAALAMQVFGSAGTDLIPLLNEGSAGIAKMRGEAVALGQTWTVDAAKGADSFNDQLARVKAGMGGVTEEIGKRLMPAVEEWMYGVELIARDTIKWLKGTDEAGAKATMSFKANASDMMETAEEVAVHHAQVTASMLENAKKLSKQEMEFREAQARKEKLLYEQLAAEKKQIERGNEEFALAMTRLRLQHEDEVSARARESVQAEAADWASRAEAAVAASEAIPRQEEDRVRIGISSSAAWEQAYGRATETVEEGFEDISRAATREAQIREQYTRLAIGSSEALRQAHRRSAEAERTGYLLARDFRLSLKKAEEDFIEARRKASISQMSDAYLNKQALASWEAAYGQAIEEMIRSSDLLSDAEKDAWLYRKKMAIEERAQIDAELDFTSKRSANTVAALGAAARENQRSMRSMVFSFSDFVTNSYAELQEETTRYIEWETRQMRGRTVLDSSAQRLPPSTLGDSGGALLDALTPPPPPPPQPPGTPFTISRPRAEETVGTFITGGLNAPGFDTYGLNVLRSEPGQEMTATIIVPTIIDGREIARTVHKQAMRGRPVTEPRRRARWK